MLTLSVGNESINASEKTNLTLRQIIQFLIILWWLNVMKVAKIVARLRPGCAEARIQLFV